MAFGATLKIHKNPILIAINPNCLWKVYASENLIKEDSLPALFDKIPCAIVRGNFRANLKIHKKSNFEPNQLIFSKSIKTCRCICIRKSYENGKAIFDLYCSTGPLASFLSNFKNS